MCKKNYIDLFDLKTSLKIDTILLKNFISLDELEKRLVLKWRNSETIRNYMVNTALISYEEHLNFIEKLKLDNTKLYFLCFHNNIPIGVINLTDINFIHKRCFLGIYASPDMNERGVGTKLINVIKTIAFDYLEMESLRLEVFDFNEHAINFYLKNGFTIEGVLRNFYLINEKFKNVVVMSMLRTEYRCRN